MMDEFDDGDISSSTDDCCNYGDDEFNVSDITTSDSDACRPLPIAMDADIKYRWAQGNDEGRGGLKTIPPDMLPPFYGIKNICPSSKKSR